MQMGTRSVWVPQLSQFCELFNSLFLGFKPSMLWKQGYVFLYTDCYSNRLYIYRYAGICDASR